MILDLDIGNTRCKWRLYSVPEEAGGSGSGTGIEPIFLDLAARKIHLERIRVANVAGAASAGAVTQLAARYFELVPEFAVSRTECGQVRNGYDDAARLGIDRWLAVCAGYHRVGGACLVVDAGSALTIDSVTASGQHEGGYIVPGLQLSQAALLKDTAGVRFPPGWDSGDTRPGHNTEQAVKRGLVMMAATFIRAARADAEERNGKLALLLTGGDAEVLLPMLAGSVQWLPELVLEGLPLVLP